MQFAAPPFSQHEAWDLARGFGPAWLNPKKVVAFLQKTRPLLIDIPVQGSMPTSTKQICAIESANKALTARNVFEAMLIGVILSACLVNS